MAFVIAIAWQLLMVAVGYALDPSQGALGHMSHWDTGWYKHIIENGYGAEASPAAPAFYPLFPLLLYLLSKLTFGMIGLELLSLLLNTAMLGLIIVALRRIISLFGANTLQQYVGVAGLLSFPSAFFLHTFYTEALFIAIALWSYLFALQRRWWAVGTLLGVLTASRLPSVLFVGLAGLEYLRSYRWSLGKALNKNLLWFLLAPVGFVAYGLHLLAVRGDFWAMFSAYNTTDDWTYHALNLNIFQTIYQTIAKTTSSIANGQFNYEIFINYALPLASLVAILASSLYLYLKLATKAVPLSIFGLMSIVMFTLNSNVVSVHRYALACVVIYVALAAYSSTKRRLLVTGVILLLSIVVQLFIYNRFIDSVFAG